MADSPSPQLQPPGLQRGLASGPHSHPGDPAEVLADRRRGREGREAGLLSLRPVPTPQTRCVRSGRLSREKWKGTPPRAGAGRPGQGAGGSERGGAPQRSPAAPYLDICCPAPAAQTRSSACRARPTSRVAAAAAAALTSCRRRCCSSPPPPPPPHPAATHAPATAAAAPLLGSPAPRGHRQPLERAQPSPPISTPPQKALTPRPRGNKPRGGARSGLPPFSPPSPALEQRGSPSGAGAGVPGADTSCPPRSPQMLPVPPRSSDPHDKPLAAPSPPNHPRCLSGSLSLDCPRPSACGRLCACAGRTPNKAGGPPLPPYRRVRILPPSLRHPGDWSVNSRPAGRVRRAAKRQAAPRPLLKRKHGRARLFAQ
ncbi:uncharacterized protein [Equus asinus]|uniref:uncharacterized protein n=1 Tax=Equus asinus TaxID=9793 RepID=UPI0038F7D03B